MPPCLKYPREFSEKERNVYLDGEAYFEVTKNRHKPFTVESDAMRVRVLGTTFNFKSDKRCRIAEATLDRRRNRSERQQGRRTNCPRPRSACRTEQKQRTADGETGRCEAGCCMARQSDTIPIKQTYLPSPKHWNASTT